jgi:hypothetical protein
MLEDFIEPLRQKYRDLALEREEELDKIRIKKREAANKAKLLRGA